MRNYLQDLLGGKLDLQNDELLVDTVIAEEDVIQGDVLAKVSEEEQQVISDDNVEETVIIETATDKIIEDQATLESLIEGMRVAIAKNGSLTTEGALFASNHVQSLTKQYGIVFEPSVTTESFTSNAEESSRLTLEAAEEAEKGLWERFKAMLVAAWNAVTSFFGSLFKTVESYKKAAQSIIARASKIDSNAKFKTQLTGNDAFFGASVSVGGGDFITEAEKNTRSIHGTLNALAKITTNLGTHVKDIEAHDDDDREAAERIEGKFAKLYLDANSGGASTYLPFGKVFNANVTGDEKLSIPKGLSIMDNPATISKEPANFTFTARDVVDLARLSLKYLNFIPSINSTVKSFSTYVKGAVLTADKEPSATLKAKRKIARGLGRIRMHFLGRQLASIVKSSAAACLSIAGKALKGLEAEAGKKA